MQDNIEHRARRLTDRTLQAKEPGQHFLAVLDGLYSGKENENQRRNEAINTLIQAVGKYTDEAYEPSLEQLQYAYYDTFEMILTQEEVETIGPRPTKNIGDYCKNLARLTVHAEKPGEQFYNFIEQMRPTKTNSLLWKRNAEDHLLTIIKVKTRGTYMADKATLETAYVAAYRQMMHEAYMITKEQRTPKSPTSFE